MRNGFILRDATENYFCAGDKGCIAVQDFSVQQWKHTIKKKIKDKGAKKMQLQGLQGFTESEADLFDLIELLEILDSKENIAEITTIAAQKVQAVLANKKQGLAKEQYFDFTGCHQQCGGDDGSNKTVHIPHIKNFYYNKKGQLLQEFCLGVSGYYKNKRLVIITEEYTVISATTAKVAGFWFILSQ